LYGAPLTDLDAVRAATSSTMSGGTGLYKYQGGGEAAGDPAEQVLITALNTWQGEH
jgi:hypothetical protein